MLTLAPSWQALLQQEWQQTYFQSLLEFLNQEQSQGQTVYPPSEQILTAFQQCPLDKLKVVILGQDPYHGDNQAHGLAFSVNKDVKIPPSLKNIYKEIQQEFGGNIPSHGHLETWSQQGVLLLNSVLTVRKKMPASHAGKGWEMFTDKVIRQISTHKQGIIFLLWGRYAQQKGKHIDTSKHTVLTAAHPSPFSAKNGFFGCQHFSKTNDILSSQGQTPIDWQIR